MNKKRPVNLDLGTLRFPVMAITSILHRISGIVLFVLLPLILFLFGRSIQSEESFNQANILISEPYYQFFIWGFCTALAYHILAGIRHMVMDLGCGESLCAGRRTAVLVIVLAVLSSIVLGIWIW